MEWIVVFVLLIGFSPRLLGGIVVGIVVFWVTPLLGVLLWNLIGPWPLAAAAALTLTVVYDPLCADLRQWLKKHFPGL